MRMSCKCAGSAFCALCCHSSASETSSSARWLSAGCRAASAWRRAPRLVDAFVHPSTRFSILRRVFPSVDALFSSPTRLSTHQRVFSSLRRVCAFADVLFPSLTQFVAYGVKNNHQHRRDAMCFTGLLVCSVPLFMAS